MSASAAARRLGTFQGLAAAALFGLSAPLSKKLLSSVSPELLAGLLYAGAALALTIAMRFRTTSTEAPLRRSDLPTLGAVTLAGGILAPIAMLYGLDRTSAVAGSLLLNLEAPFTILVAVIVFGEFLDRRSAAAAVLVVGGAAVLGFGPGELRTDVAGVLLLAVACALWAVDNNLTQKLTDRDPFQIVRAKATIAGVANTAVALLRGADLPAASTIGAALVVGASAYGLSVLLDAYALRHVGAAREAALFATGPFFGALAAVVLLDETLTVGDLAAAAAMGAGIALLLTAGHEHEHTHRPLDHEHRHRHDDGHHGHVHDPPVAGWHAHPHTHAPITHAHPHDSDVHHRHDH